VTRSVRLLRGFERVQLQPAEAREVSFEVGPEDLALWDLSMQRTVEPGRYVIEVIDLLVNPRLAAGDQILAVPTLVRKFPEPIRKIIGDLSNEERVLVGLDVQPVRKAGA
jgi:hypothetical protein